MTAKRKTTKSPKWHKYTGHEWLKGAEHEVQVLKGKKACKDAKIVKEVEHDGKILYWVYTHPKVSTSEFRPHDHEWQVPSHLHNSM